MLKSKFKAIIYIIIVGCLFSSHSVKAGIVSKGEKASKISYMHSLGASYMVGISESSFIGMAAATYHARLNCLVSSESVSFSIGVPLSIAASTERGELAIEIPIVANINFGHFSTKDNSSNFGGYLGAGYGFNSMTYSSSTSFGVFSGGEQFSGTYFDLGVRYSGARSFTLGGYSILSGDGNKLFGIRLLVNFGVVNTN